MANTSGAPKAEFDVVDRSIVRDQPVAGFIILQGPAKRGKRGFPYEIGSPVQYTRLLGGEYGDTERFPSNCLRILNGGGKIIVIRAFHYTDVADRTTAAGTKSQVVLNVSSNGSTWRAEEVGDGYDGTTIDIKAPASGLVGYVDVYVQLKDSDIKNVMRDVKTVQTAGEIADTNLRAIGIGLGVELVSIATNIVITAGVLAGGAQTLASIVATDYNGSAAGQTGWFIADQVLNAYRIAQIAVELPAVDEGLRVYCEMRQDMRYKIKTPMGINATGMIAYRNGTSPYSHNAHDSWYGSLVAGDILISDPNNRDKQYNIPGLVDVNYLESRKDVKYAPWISTAGAKRGKVLMPNNGQQYNLATPALASDHDSVQNAGINPVVNDPQFGMCYWGVNSLWKNRTSLLKDDNVGDLVVYFIRNLKPAVRLPIFDPLNPETWKEIYRRALPIISDVESRKGIRPGEDENWFWLGDQKADTFADIKYNTNAQLSQGIYRIRFVFVPINVLKFIAIELTITDANSVQFVVNENPFV